MAVVRLNAALAATTLVQDGPQVGAHHAQVSAPSRLCSWQEESPAGLQQALDDAMDLEADSMLATDRQPWIRGMRLLVEQLGALEARCTVAGDKVSGAMVMSIKHFAKDLAAMADSGQWPSAFSARTTSTLDPPKVAENGCTAQGRIDSLSEQVEDLQQRISIANSGMEAESKRANFWVQRAEALSQSLQKLETKEPENIEPRSSPTLKLRELLSRGTAKTADEEALLEWLHVTDARAALAEAERDHAVTQLKVVEQELVEKLSRDTLGLRTQLDAAIQTAAIREEMLQTAARRGQELEDAVKSWTTRTTTASQQAPQAPAMAHTGGDSSSGPARGASIGGLEASAKRFLSWEIPSPNGSSYNMPLPVTPSVSRRSSVPCHRVQPFAGSVLVQSPRGRDALVRPPSQRHAWSPQRSDSGLRSPMLGAERSSQWMLSPKASAPSQDYSSGANASSTPRTATPRHPAADANTSALPTSQCAGTAHMVMATVPRVVPPVQRLVSRGSFNVPSRAASVDVPMGPPKPARHSVGAHPITQSALSSDGRTK